MNPSVVGWINPPPPGTDVAQEDDNSSTSSKNKSMPSEESQKVRSIDQIDPYLKNPDYVEYKKHIHSSDRSSHRKRSRSKSEKDRKGRDSVKKHRSRSRNRSRSRGHRHRRYRSHSRSPSPSKSRHRKSKKEKRHRRSTSRTRRHSRSYSRSRSHSRSRRGHRHSRARHSRNRDGLHSEEEKDDQLNTSGEVDDDDEPMAKENAFKNDGSFLEMFKKMQEEQEKAAEAAKEQAGSSEMKKPLPAFGKRRGGRVLKTGLVEKSKFTEETSQEEALDAWSVYMKEVKRYKEACCDDDSKTRPLVK